MSSRILTIVLTSILSVLLIAGLVFGIVWITSDSNKNQSVPSPNPQGTSYISKRTFSLRFSGNDGTAGYGTGWLFAKDKDNDLSYYLATNLHVAAFVQNTQDDRYEWNKEWIKSKGYKFNKLSFGQVISRNKDSNKLELGTNLNSLPANKTLYSQYVPMNSVSIAYTTFDMFNKLAYDDPYSVFNDQIVKNGTMDFALLKVDFSSRQWNGNFTTEIREFDPLLQSLKNFDSDPTKFAKTHSEKNTITVAGFPYKEIGGTGAGAFEAASNISVSDKFAGLLMDNSDWNVYYKIASSIDIETFKKYYVLPSFIPYYDDDFSSRRNVAFQYIMNNLDLDHGSSGSMAINEKNEVVGIYWGSYSTVANGHVKNMGAIDLFISDKTISNKLQVISKPYNVFDDIQSKLKKIIINY